MRAASPDVPRVTMIRGNALTAILVVLAIIVVLAVAALVTGRLSSDQPAASPEVASSAPAADAPEAIPPAPTPPPAAEPPLPNPTLPVPATATDPAPVAGPDVATIAQTPALWPKAVSLTQPVTIPVIIGGKTAGQAQLPARTTVRLVRVVGQQVELEHLNQRLTAPITSTDLLARATALAKAGPGTMAAAVSPPSPAQRATPPAQAPQVPSMKSPAAPRQTSDRYRTLALEVMDDIQQKYWLRETGRYAKKPGSREADTVWGAGVMFSAVVGAARHEPGKYKPVLNKFFEGLDGYWDTKAKIPGYEPAPTSGNGNDKYYDDNAWMVITFLEAYELTRSPRFQRRAEETLDFVLSGWDETLGGGIWWHETKEKKAKGKNTCANAPSAVGCLLSAQYSQPQAAKQRREWAEKIVAWTAEHLQLDNALFADSIGLDGGMNRAQLTYNSALMVRAYLGLHRVSKNPKHLKEAQRIARAAESLLSSETGAYRDPVKWAHLMVEADLELYRTTGEEYLLQRATRNADVYYETWKNSPPDDLISIASIARTLWLMADAESDVGRKFWQSVDSGKGP